MWRKQQIWCTEELYIFIFIEFIISARRFQPRPVCGYEYVKLQGWDLPVDRLLFRRLSQFLDFESFLFFSGENYHSCIWINCYTMEELSIQVLHLENFTHQGRGLFRAAGCQTSTAIFMILPANYIRPFYLFFHGWDGVKQQDLQDLVTCQSSWTEQKTSVNFLSASGSNVDRERGGRRPEGLDLNLNSKNNSAVTTF